MIEIRSGRWEMRGHRFSKLVSLSAAPCLSKGSDEDDLRESTWHDVGA